MLFVMFDKVDFCNCCKKPSTLFCVFTVIMQQVGKINNSLMRTETETVHAQKIFPAKLLKPSEKCQSVSIFSLTSEVSVQFLSETLKNGISVN